MKIGILTYHRSHNCGALLQAIALRKVLADMGHQVSFIDYWPAYHRHLYMVFPWRTMLDQKGINKIKYAINCLKNYRSRKERIANFETFIENNIEPYTSSCEETYDLIIHGSDQIWRKQPEIHTYNPVYFGKHNIKTKKKISYAASMGILPFSEEENRLLKQMLSNLDEITVREIQLMNFVKALGYPCSLCLDPTLLLTIKQWKKTINIEPAIENNYILYYELQANAFNKKEMSKLAKENKLSIKTIYSSAIKQNTDNEITTANPLKFLSLINGASLILTSSFHGLVFSLLFHKPFYASFITNSGRASSLLNQLGLNDRLIKPQAKLPSIINDIDYDVVDVKINEIKNESLSILYKMI